MSNLRARVKAEGNPLIDGDTVTFVWDGKKAPYLHLETNNFRPVELENVATKLWVHTIKLPSDAYIEYNFAKKKNKPKSIVVDPYNSKTTDTGVGHDNHYFSMPDRIHTPLIKKRKGIDKGTVTKHALDLGIIGAGISRDVWLYAPVATEPVPLLVVLDGKDYYERGKIVQIVDNLIADGKIEPIALAMIDNAGAYRMAEYNQNESIPMMLDWSLLPLAKKHLNLIDTKDAHGAYGILGASMGGLMALYIGLRMPDIFGKVISQAGAFFTYQDGREALIHLMVDLLPPAPIKIWQDCGIYDWLHPVNVDMLERLQRKDYDVTYVEHSGGHNYTSWRDLLPSALETMFGVS